jgi:hypothetical protein
LAKGFTIKEVFKKMSVIYLGEYNDYLQNIDVLCPSCKKVVATASLSEIAEWANANLQTFCFDCDQVGQDEVPQQLLSRAGEVVLIKPIVDLVGPRVE